MSTIRAYYNDNEPYICEWARNLIKAGLVPDGEVDERSITDVTADDLRGFTQCHFFCGILGWPLAFRMAGWPADRPVWSASLPCQPFSVAGRGAGADDPRHLWPEMRRLIAECRPQVVFGEQVSSAEVVGTQLEASFIVAVQAGDYARANRLAHRLARSKGFHYWRRWVDGVSTDLAELGYSWGHAVCGAHSVGAPHIRQRLWWCAERLADRPCGGQREHGGAPGQPGPADQRGASERLADAERGKRGSGWICGRREAGESLCTGAAAQLTGRSVEGGMAEPAGEHGAWRFRERDRAPGPEGQAGDCCDADRLGDACGTGLERRAGQRGDDGAQLATAERAGGHWGNTWLQCSDGTARRVEPAIPCLAARLPTRVDELCSGLQGMGHVPRSDASAILKQARRFRKGVLRGAGNAIVPQVAAEFIRAYMEAAT